MRVAVELRSVDPLDQLRGLCAAQRQLDLWQRETIAQARQQGAAWSEIGEALGVSKQAAWKLFNEDVRDLLGEVRRCSGLSDDEAQRLADDVRAAHAARGGS